MDKKQKSYNAAGAAEAREDARRDGAGNARAESTENARGNGAKEMRTEKIGQVTLDYTYYPGEDRYSDGGVEDEMLRIAKECDEDGFGDAIVRSRSWPILYHFSHVRENIIDWLPMSGQESVLEIGAGPGAITGALVKKARQVTCIDLSKKRSLINAYRHRDCGNLRILVGNFQDIERSLEEQFDLITLIGVFEYAQYSIQAEDPFVEYLSRIRRHLRPGGRLVIAIENRLGLKYWAGATEDHTGLYFEGLEGYPTTDYVRTFSRPELEDVMQQAGFDNYGFYYPYPDYKLPEKLYSDAYLPKKGELNRNRQNLDRERIQLFSEERVYDSLEGSGLFSQFSNSFFVICEAPGSASDSLPETAQASAVHSSPEGTQASAIHSSPETVQASAVNLSPGDTSILASGFRVIFTKYSNERDRRFRIRTDILEEGGARRIRKTALEPEAVAHIAHIYDCYLELKKDLAGTSLSVNECVPGEIFGAGDGVYIANAAEIQTAKTDFHAGAQTAGTDRYAEVQAAEVDLCAESRTAEADLCAENRAAEADLCAETRAEVSFPWVSGRTLEEELDELLQKRRIGEVKERIRAYFTLFSDDDWKSAQTTEIERISESVQTTGAERISKSAQTTGAGQVSKPAQTTGAARISEFVQTPEFARVFGEVSFARPQESRAVSDIDMIFSNVIRTAGGWELIDYEWTFCFPVPLRYIRYRCLHYYIQGNAARACGELDERQLMEEFDITPDEQRQFAAMERSFQRYILGGYRPIWKQYDDISDGVIEIAPLVKEESLRKKRNPAAVWFDTGNGFAEESCREYPLARTEGASLEIELPEGTRALRLGPFSGRCLVRLGGVAQDGQALEWTSNGSPADNGDLIFDTDDPRIEIRTPGDGPVWITFGVEPLTGFARELILYQHGRIRWMEQTKVWRLYRKLKGSDDMK